MRDMAVLLLPDWISVEWSEKRLNAYQATDCDNVLFWLLVPSGGGLSLALSTWHLTIHWPAIETTPLI